MNYRLLARFLGIILSLVGFSMGLAALWGFCYSEEAATETLLVSVSVTLGIGIVLYLFGRGAHGVLSRREGLAVVGLGWLLAALFGSLPFVFSGAIPHPVDAYFETMSGFTTTGASIIADIEALPRSLLFWRSFTHWLGGMGIVVLLVGMLPHLGVGGKRLFRSEVPGPDPEVLGTRIRHTATTLWLLYLGLSLGEVVLLWVQGLSLFDSLCHTFGTMATGGFSTYRASIGHYHSLGVELTVILFMFLAGANFALYGSMLRGRGLRLWQDGEWRAYAWFMGVGTLLVTLDLWRAGQMGGVLSALRAGSFQVVSIGTTTGYCTADFDGWPPLSRVLLLVFMFVGGCAGSTGGSMKVVRVLVVAKYAYIEAQRVFRPALMRSVRIGQNVVPSATTRGIMAYFALFIGIFVVAALALAAMSLDATTAVSASAACLGNVGPGLGGVGASQNYSGVPMVGKALLAFCMLVGRLEIFTVVALLLPNFWKR